MVARLMAYDKNGDQQLTLEELPGRMRRMMERGDKNSDGSLDEAEIRGLTAAGGRPVGGRSGGGRAARPDRPQRAE